MTCIVFGLSTYKLLCQLQHCNNRPYLILPKDLIGRLLGGTIIPRTAIHTAEFSNVVVLAWFADVGAFVLGIFWIGGSAADNTCEWTLFSVYSNFAEKMKLYGGQKMGKYQC